MSKTEYFRVKNLEEFQHYKDRTPPWIKLYNNILDDYEFGCLQDASKLHLVLIWLLASRNNNKLPVDPKWIAARINASDAVNLDCLFEFGFLEKYEENQQLQTIKKGASKTLAKRKQSACLEGETEKRREEYKKDTPNGVSKKKVSRETKYLDSLDFNSWPEHPTEQVWRDYKKHRQANKAPLTQTVINRMAEELSQAAAQGFSVDDCLAEAMAAGWQGFKFEWFIKRRNGYENGKSSALPNNPADEALYRKYPHLRPQ